jgi:hypothetical protein
MWHSGFFGKDGELEIDAAPILPARAQIGEPAEDCVAGAASYNHGYG